MWDVCLRCGPAVRTAAESYLDAVWFLADGTGSTPQFLTAALLGALGVVGSLGGRRGELVADEPRR